MYYTSQNSVLELTFCSEKFYQHPFGEAELDLVLEEQNGSKSIVPAFWAG